MTPLKLPDTVIFQIKSLSIRIYLPKEGMVYWVTLYAESYVVNVVIYEVIDCKETVKRDGSCKKYRCNLAIR